MIPFVRGGGIRYEIRDERAALDVAQRGGAFARYISAACSESNEAIVAAARASHKRYKCAMLCVSGMIGEKSR
jgi:hypothetical protein